MTPTSTKIAYIAPKLVELGTFEQLTKASFKGGYLDGFYPRGTPTTQPILS